VLTSQPKLMAALIGLLILGVAIAGGVAERSLRRDQIAQTETSLAARARLVVDQLSGEIFAVSNREILDDVADRTGKAGSMRVTIIGLDGVVLGDSGVPLSRLPDIKNHADRPEVRVAITGTRGTATRRSETVGQELVYLALPADGRGIVRVAVALSDLESALTTLRRRLILAGGLGIIVAMGLSFLVTRSALKPIREVRQAAEAIARGDLEERPPLYVSKELGEISNAIREIASQLRSRLEDATDEKERLRAVLESMVEGVLVVDASGMTLLANSRLREFYGLRDDVEGRPLLEAIRSPELDSLLHDVAETNQTVVRTFSLADPARTVRVQAVRFPRSEAPRSGSVAVFHDISELERLDEVRRDFVANASHELRTPLTAIQGFTETLLGTQLSEEKRKSYLEIIERHAFRLAAIVHDLLALSTAETRTIHNEPVSLDVAETARGVIQDLEPRWIERELDLRCKVEGKSVAMADAQSLIQILTNLLDNAIKYTEPGGEIEVCLKEEPGRLRVFVRDTGIGIPEEDRARIFERFFRVDRARSRSQGGTGLGLSIVRHLVQAQGGEISVQSRLGEGTTFSFSLPRS
jgi:two-component system phosphate regulon sensor histidine kinase PhoR